MSDKRDEKSNQTPDAGQEYSVEEILTEFSSARNSSRVVQFPVPPKDAAEPRKSSAPSSKGKVIDLPSEDPVFDVTQRLKGLFRRAENYADQMYSHAEPTREERRAEQYIPGVDQEEEPPPKPPRRIKYVRSAPPPPEDISPAKLAARYSKGLTSSRVRLAFSAVLTVLCIWLSLPLPLLPLPLPVTDYHLRLLGCTVLLAAVCLLCADVLWTGLQSLVFARPGAETLCMLCAVFTLGDALSMPVWDTRADTLPCAAPACLVLVFALWGRRCKQRGDRLACRTAIQSRHPYLLTADDAKWSGRPAYCKWSGSPQGFGSQIQTPDGLQRVYRVAAPLLLLACLVCSLLASAGRQVPRHFLWAASATFTAASSLSSLLAYSLPYHTLVRRLSKSGAALAGWPGAARCRDWSMILTDTDLFPPGAVKLNGIKIFGDFSNEKVIAYAATLIRISGSGLDKPFSDLMTAENALYRSADNVRFYEGGLSGVIRGHEVLVGTAAFMHLMNIALPQGLNVKTAVFCSINGDLAGIFALHYAMHPAVSPCLTTLIRNNVSPLLATRDPNLLPTLLGQKFKLPTDKLEFPSVERRLELSDGGQQHDPTLSALLCREGLEPYCDAVVGAKRLRTAVYLGAALSVLGSCVGLVIAFYLTYMDAYLSLSPAAMLVFLLGWLVPTLVLSDWSARF